MKFIFWQNIISLHQAAFLSVLSENHDVSLFVEETITESRQNEGWSAPTMGCVKIKVLPSDQKIQQLISEDSEIIHVFSGIDAYPMVYKAFKQAVKFNSNVMVYLEPYEWHGIKGLLRRCKYIALQLRFGKKISALLPTGETGCLCYKKAYFEKHKLFEWGYFTQKNHVEYFTEYKGYPRLLFVGSLDDNKNSLYLIDVLKSIQLPFDSFNIIGRGPLQSKILKSIDNFDNMDYLGTKPNIEVQKIMQKSDILILPSKYDGWGAVINEALQNGMRVIASENCGASVLLDGQYRGESFSYNKPNHLNEILEKWIKKGPLTQDDRESIINWCNNTISGEKATEYFLQICKHVFEKEAKPKAPWK